MVDRKKRQKKDKAGEKMAIFEGVNCGFRTMTREFVERMNRSELVEWLEFRGSACYDHESTELLRQAALEDFGHDEFAWDFK